MGGIGGNEGGERLFQTKRSLKKRIAELEADLALEHRKTRESALISKAGLPKCKGLYCFQCVYVVLKPSGYFGESYMLLGCGKNAGCEDFTPAHSQTKIESCPSYQQAMQSGLMPR